MPEPERPFYFICGKCDSAGIYRDGDGSLACLMCGNRYYGMVAGKAKGTAPKKVYREEEMAKIAKCIECGREMTIIGKGLCGKCYHKSRRAKGGQTKPVEQKPSLPAIKYRPDSQEIPLTIRLTIDVTVRVNGVAA